MGRVTVGSWDTSTGAVAARKEGIQEPWLQGSVWVWSQRQADVQKQDCLWRKLKANSMHLALEQCFAQPREERWVKALCAFRRARYLAVICFTSPALCLSWQRPKPRGWAPLIYTREREARREAGPPLRGPFIPTQETGRSAPCSPHSHTLLPGLQPRSRGPKHCGR